MPFTSSSLSEDERLTLLTIAKRSIVHGLEHGEPLAIDPRTYPEALRPVRATFVTLQNDGKLRGCIGALDATDPLVLDVAKHAHAAAFHDPRFQPLVPDELARIDVHISILSPPEPIAFETEDDLLAQLRPGIDGLVLTLGDNRATFLPAVWDTLPEPRDFVAHLKIKAGFEVDFWSKGIAIGRYTTESFGEMVGI